MSDPERAVLSTPGATYRVQLHGGFGFADVARIAPYLSRLGITHVYCSPYLQAHPGSTHGYDVEDHTRLNEELGGPEAYGFMVDVLAANGLSQVLDIVPNHVSIAGRGNTRWWDVLKHGRASGFARYFDIDWEPEPHYLKDKVLVPVLGGELEAIVERGEIVAEEESGGEVVLRYHEHVVPVAPDSISDVGTAAQAVERLNADQQLLLDVLGRQHYVLASWRRAATDLNYRRFFDINTLAGLQIHEEGVFDETHGLVLELVANGSITGLRVDHIDGLRDPLGYLWTLAEASGGAYVVVEKILEPGEELPETWPVAGTSGYDFLNVVGGLFVDPDGEAPLSELYRRFTGETKDLPELTRALKHLIMRNIMISDVTRITNELVRVFEQEGWPYERDDLRSVLEETIASFHVYRTYVSPEGAASDYDVHVIDAALAAARGGCASIDNLVFDRLRSVLLLESGGDQGRAFTMRFQQTTGPIMAKGVEDTVFYNFNRFVALNEVGGDPGTFGTSVAAFHSAATRAATNAPAAMLATSTHDTKRSEDVRARLALLSEMPTAWGDAVDRWAKIADRHRTDGLPDANAEYLLYQTLVGAHPLGVERAVAYMQKASKEAKRHTSWIDPEPRYDEALEAFVRGLLADDEFVEALDAFTAPLIEPGRVSSLAQTLVQLTYPGVPDTYQGTEVWDLSLVDPDNRRPVDYDLRSALLRFVQDATGRDLWPPTDVGAAKLFVTTRALNLRRRMPELFARGSYTPIGAAGDRAAHVVAYLRGDDVAVVVPRLVLGLGGDWGTTSIEVPQGGWFNELTDETVEGGTLDVGGLLAEFPVALLRRSV